MQDLRDLEHDKERVKKMFALFSGLFGCILPFKTADFQKLTVNM